MSVKNVIGTVMKCGAYQLKAPETFVWEGKSITNTHRLSMQIKSDSDSSEEWYGLGGTDKESFFVKRLEGEGYAVLGAGSKVLLQYKKNGDFNNAKKSGLTVMTLVEGQAYDSKDKAESGSKGASQPFDITGVLVGLAVNSALDYYGHKLKPDNPAVEEKAKEIHNLRSAAESWYQSKNPSMSKRDVGASVGHAVRNACKANIALKTKKADPDLTVDQLKTYVQSVLALTQPLSAFIKGEGGSQEAVQEPTESVKQEDVQSQAGGGSEAPLDSEELEGDSETPW